MCTVKNVLRSGRNVTNNSKKTLLSYSRSSVTRYTHKNILSCSVLTSGDAVSTLTCIVLAVYFSNANGLLTHSVTICSYV
jgi:hypothetical protein